MVMIRLRRLGLKQCVVCGLRCIAAVYATLVISHSILDWVLSRNSFFVEFDIYYGIAKVRIKLFNSGLEKP